MEKSKQDGMGNQGEDLEETRSGGKEKEARKEEG